MWNINSYKSNGICATNSYGQLCQQSYVATWVYWHLSSNYSSDMSAPSRSAPWATVWLAHSFIQPCFQEWPVNNELEMIWDTISPSVQKDCGKSWKISVMAASLQHEFWVQVLLNNGQDWYPVNHNNQFPHIPQVTKTWL